MHTFYEKTTEKTFREWLQWNATAPTPQVPYWVVRGPLEFVGCSLCIRFPVLVDAQGAPVAWTFSDCGQVTVMGARAAGCRTADDDGGEAHGFSVRGGGPYEFYQCVSRSASRDELHGMEDHFHAHESRRGKTVRPVKDVLFRECVAWGPTKVTGTGFCFDRGVAKGRALRCKVRGVAYTGITVAAGSVAIQACSIEGAHTCIRASDEWYGQRISLNVQRCGLAPSEGGYAVWARTSRRVRVTADTVVEWGW